MRLTFSALTLAFLTSWAVAEWPRTTECVVTGLVEAFDGRSLIIGPHDIRLRDDTIIERVDTGTRVAPLEVTPGERATVTLRCVPNHVPACVVARVRLVGDITLH